MFSPNKVYTFGDREKPALLFIHGFPMSARMWQPQIQELCNDYFCVSYDIRGLGASPIGPYPFTMETLVEDLIAVMDSQNLITAGAIGLSMGGYILLRALERFPEKFTAIVLCDTKSTADENQAKLRRADAIRNVAEKGAKDFVTNFVRSIVHPNSISLMGKQFDELTFHWSQNSEEGVIACQLAMLGRTDTTDVLGKISIPVTFIVGEHDTLTPPAAMMRMAEMCPGSRLHIIGGAGHLAPLEMPVKVNPVISEFLANIYAK